MKENLKSIVQIIFSIGFLILIKYQSSPLGERSTDYNQYEWYQLLLIPSIFLLLFYLLPYFIFSKIKKSSNGFWEFDKVPIKSVLLVIVVTPFVTVLALKSNDLANNLLVSWGHQEIHGDSSFRYFLSNYLRQEAGLKQIVLFVLVFSIFPAIVEELFYRGLLQRSMSSLVPTILPVLIIALLFALAHTDPSAYTAKFIIGFYFGYLYYRTGNITLSATAHVLNNLISFFFLFIT